MDTVIRQRSWSLLIMDSISSQRVGGGSSNLLQILHQFFFHPLHSTGEDSDAHRADKLAIEVKDGDGNAADIQVKFLLFGRIAFAIDSIKLLAQGILAFDGVGGVGNKFQCVQNIRLRWQQFVCQKQFA